MVVQAGQGDVTSTPEFKAWFAGSKCVDKQGNPLRVYHGTDQNFDTFDPKRVGMGNDHGMRGRGFYFSSNERTAASYGPNVIPVYVSIKNPFKPSDFKSKQDICDRLGIDEDIFEYTHDAEFKVYQSFSGVLTSALKDAGYDGVDYPFRQEIVTFESNQIKSAIGNSGKFDPKNPSITASKTAAREIKPITGSGWLTWNGIYHKIKIHTPHSRAALRLGLATRGSGDSENEINLEALQGGNIRIMGTEFEAWKDNADTRDLIARVLEVSKFPHVTIEFRNQVEGYGRAYERNMSVESALQWMYSGVRPGFDKNSASKTAMDRQSRNAHYFIQWLVRKGCPYDGSVRPYHSSSVTVTFPSGNLEVTFDRNAPEIKGTETVYVGPGGVTPIEARRMVSQRMREAIKEGNTLKDGEWVAPEKEVPTLRFTLDEQSRKSGFLLIMVDTQKLDQEWARPANNVRLAPGSMENHIGTRYARFEQWLKDNPGTPIEAPYVSWDTYPTPDKGGVHFNNGRHRFAVLRDMGAQKVGIAISKEQLPYFKPIMVGGSKTAAVVDNPKFQAWFKGSKITDSHGRPLIMYHGTNQNFDKFDLAKQGEKDSGWYGAGIYLTADTDTASGYAVYNKLKDDSPADGANVMPLYVKMVSPYYWPKDRKAAMNREEAQAITEELKASGHDGVVVHNEYADPSVANHYEVVVFSPNQIKSAIGNSGEFNPKKHNITAADEIEIQEHRITAEESAFEGTTAPGMRIEAHSDEGTVAALEIYFDKGNAYVRGITVASHYRGQGIGQKLYDRAIVLAKEEGCAGFYSDKSNCMSNDAHKAWDRLRKRYKVEFEPGEDGYDASGRKKINLKTAALKTAMNITVPESEETHFWEEPAEGMEEFWAFRWPVRALVGDRIIFNLRKKPIAEAVISRIEKPGQHECSTTGRFKNMWKVYWTNESFKRMEPKIASASDNTYYHVTPHRRTSKILREGLVTGKKPQWQNRLNQNLGDRDKIYLMNHFDAAIRWAFKMEWDKQAKIDILKIEMNIPDIETDMNFEAQMNKIDGQYAWMMTSTPIPPEAIKQVIPLTTEMKQDFVKRQNESWGKSGARIPQEDVPHFLGTEDSTQPLPGEEFPDYITRQMENDKDYTRGVAVATKAGIPVVRSYVDLPPVAEGKVRIYHGTRPDALEGIAREGVKNFPGHGQAGVLATR
jgi:ribosomal protein S18 acetylase RimI-like enzyme